MIVSFLNIRINDRVVEEAQMYKYLGTVFDKKLTFEGQVDAVCKKKSPSADVFTACIAVLRRLACLGKCFILGFTAAMGCSHSGMGTGCRA